MFKAKFIHRTSRIISKKEFDNPIDLFNFIKSQEAQIEIVEEWKWIKGYEGRYKVSNLGRVQSYNRAKIMIMKQRATKFGYLRIDIYSKSTTGGKKQNRKSPLVHNLVADHFCYNPEPEILDEVDHINGYCDHNEFWNLRHCDRTTNLENRNFNRGVPF